jgi:hypothetical protein
LEAAQELVTIGQHNSAAGNETAIRIEFVEFSIALFIKNSEFIEARATRVASRK